MSMSSAGRAANSSDCVARPRGHEIGLSGFAVQNRPSSLTGSYVMVTAEHREPYESRGSRTVLGAPGGETPPGDSTIASILACSRYVCFHPDSAGVADIPDRPLRARSRHHGDRQQGKEPSLSHCELSPRLRGVRRATVLSFET